MNEFPYVFFDDLPGMLPDREIEFGIEVILKAQPIYIPLYLIALTELSELKN